MPDRDACNIAETVRRKLALCLPCLIIPSALAWHLQGQGWNLLLNYKLPLQLVTTCKVWGSSDPLVNNSCRQCLIEGLAVGIV